MDNRRLSTIENERVKLDYNIVKRKMIDCKNQQDLAKQLGCGVNKLREYLIENELYDEYCSIHNIPNKARKEIACCVCGEKKSVYLLNEKPYCKKHYNQMYRYGKIYENTIYDKNEYIFEEDIVKIILKDKYQNYKSESIIDVSDYEKICNYKWYESYGYCVTKSNDYNEGIDIANILFNNYEDRFDHQNHNKLDNRRCNLRPVTAHQNSMNMSKKCTNTSGVTGVRRQNKTSEKWIAAITYNYKSIWLGVDYSFDRMVIERLKGEARYFKEFSPNYNLEKKLICLNYVSRDDNLDHYIEMDLNGNIVKNVIVSNDLK